MNIKVLIRFIGIFLILQSVSSSKAPCDLWWGGLTYQFKMLKKTHPPLTLDMPYDIMRGYLTFFDIETNSDYYTFKKYLDKQTFLTDSIKNLIGYLYKLQDYNSILLSKYNKTEYIDTIITFSPSIFERDIKNFYFKFSNNITLDKALINSDFIFHIIADKIDYYPTKGDYIITAKIIDTLKGKVIPNFRKVILPDSLPRSDSLDETAMADLGSTIVFELRDDSKNFLNLPYSEYFCFIDLYTLCIDSSNNYENFYMLTDENMLYDGSYTIFPIDGKNVLDTNNVMGFGKIVDIDVWKSKIRNRINEIKNSILTLSVPEPEIYNKNLQIFPNPVKSSILNVQFECQARTGLDYEIISPLGLIVKYEKINPVVNPFTINLENLASGIYYIILKHDGINETKKFILNN